MYVYIGEGLRRDPEQDPREQYVVEGTIHFLSLKLDLIGYFLFLLSNGTHPPAWLPEGAALSLFHPLDDPEAYVCANISSVSNFRFIPPILFKPAQPAGVHIVLQKQTTSDLKQ